MFHLCAFVACLPFLLVCVCVVFLSGLVSRLIILYLFILANSLFIIKLDAGLLPFFHRRDQCVSSMELCIMPTVNLLFALKKVFDDENITWGVAEGVSLQLARKQEYLNPWERVELALIT